MTGWGNNRGIVQVRKCVSMCVPAGASFGSMQDAVRVCV